MQPMDEYNQPLGPLEAFEQERLMDLLEKEGVDHVKVVPIERMSSEEVKGMLDRAVQKEGERLAEHLVEPFRPDESVSMSCSTVPVKEEAKVSERLLAGDEFTLRERRYQVVKVLSRGRTMLKEVGTG